MSSSYVSFSTPALRKLTHLADYTCTTSYVEVLPARTLPERRVVVIIQNKDSSAKLEVVFDSTGTAGLIIPPEQTISIENYNGVVRLKSNTGGSIAHIAYGSV
jgi:hypothetical protein